MSKREEIRERRRRQEKRNRILTIGIVTAVAIAVVALLVVPPLIQANQPVGAIKTAVPVDRPNADGLNMGDPNAPIKVVEYSDFQCPFCRMYTENLEPTVIKDYISTGKVYFTYVPYSFIGPESLAAAEASYCANDQGKFWEYHDILFANQKDAENAGAFTQNRLLAFGESLGLDMNQFRSCVTSNKYSSQVRADVTQGSQAGVQATPTFSVNGKLVGQNDLVQTIQDALATAGG